MVCLDREPMLELLLTCRILGASCPITELPISLHLLTQ